MWLRKNKWKLIIPLLILAVLAAAFYYGGNAPGSRGWTAGESAGAVSEPPAPSETPESTEAPAESPRVSAEPTAQPAPPPSEEPAPSPSPSEEPEADGGSGSAYFSPAAPPESTMAIDPDTGKDRYETDPVPSGKPLPVEPQDVTIGSAAYTCTISISCAAILNNMDYCSPEKRELVPRDGWILMPVQAVFYEGESVFNVLQRTCKQQGIHMEFANTPIYNSAYIEGIYNLYEFDAGEQSGWMYKVNEWFPNYGCSRYQLKDGDVVCWVYTCDLGGDVGGGYAVGS